MAKHRREISANTKRKENQKRNAR